MNPTRPPTEYLPPDPPPRENRWPGVLGVIALVLGVLTVLGSCINILMATAFVDAFSAMAPQQQNSLDVFKEHRFATLALAIASLLLGATLIVGAVGLLNRRRWCASLLIGWAVAKVLLVPITMLLQWSMMEDQVAAGRAAGGPFGAGFYDMITMGSVGLGLLTSLAPPVFAIIWFTRPKIRAEVKQWPAGGGRKLKASREEARLGGS